MTADTSYLDSLRAIRPREVEQFQQRRTNGVYRDTPPIQELFEVAVIAAWQAHQSGEVVTPETIRRHAPELSELQVAELCESPYFRQALTARGIPEAAHLDKLDNEQWTALQVMTDPSIQTPVLQRLKRLGISYRRWQGWLRQPVFAAALGELRAKLREDTVAPIELAMQMAATKGDVAAAKLTLELAGVYTPGASTMAAERQLDDVVRRLHEAIQLFVKDDETLRAIGEYVRTGEMPVDVVTLPLPGVVEQ